MKISILGYGRLWTTRAPGTNRTRAAHFNTTAIEIKGIARSRSRLYGHVRIDECLGFRPDLAARTIGRVFETEGICEWNGRRKLYLSRLHPEGTAPETYLIRFSNSGLSAIDPTADWLCATGKVLSFSESHCQQEVLVVLPPFGWIRTGTGLCYLIPEVERPYHARLLEKEKIACVTQ